MSDPVDIAGLVRDLEAPEGARRRDALVGLSEAGHDLGFMVEQGLAHAGETNAEVRAAAMQCFGVLARVHLRLPVAQVLPVIEAGRHDGNQLVRDQAEIAFAEVERFLLDPPKPDETVDDDDETIDIPSMNVAAAIRRNMRRTHHWMLSRGPFRRDEWRVGWYFNPAPHDRWRLLFTTTALHVVSDDSAWRIDWSAVDGTREDADGIHVETAEGEARFVPVAGRHGEGDRSNDTLLVLTVMSILKPR